MNPKLASLATLIGLLILVAIVVAWLSAYSLDETESAVVVQFGDPVGEPITSAGLHWKTPLIQDVRKFDKRLLTWDGAPEAITTVGQRNIEIDTTARWRIADPLKFLQSVRDEASAQSRLDDIIDSVVRDEIASTELVEIVRSADWDVSASDIQAVETAVTQERKQTIEKQTKLGREQLTRQILQIARKRAGSLGIDLVDVRIKRLNYVQQVQQEVFKRMISERQRIADKYRSEGEEQSKRVHAEADLSASKIVAEAKREAESTRGRADAQATRVYNDAYTADPAFYAFSRTLDSYGKTLGQGTVLMLSSDSPYLRYLRGSGVGDVDDAATPTPDTDADGAPADAEAPDDAG